VTVAAAVLTLACVGAALLSPWLAPQNPFDAAALNLNDAFKPPAWEAGGDPAYLLGTDNQGRDLSRSCTARACRSAPPVLAPARRVRGSRVGISAAGSMR
jgi:ABC-type antimicrobial peptide transport system permease subunit